MTVCIGVLCESRSAVILVADRMLTSGLDIEFEHPVSNKVTELSPTCYALTAGDAFAFTELFTDVKGAVFNRKYTGVEDFVEVVKKSYQSLRMKQIVERILMPMGFNSIDNFYGATRGIAENVSIPLLGQIENFSYGLTILMGGVSPNGQGHLYSVMDPGTSICIDSTGFHAIGSGTNLALGNLIAEHCHEQMGLAEALVVAMGAKAAAENAPGVGKKTDAALISAELGTIRFQDDDITALKELAQRRRIGDESYLDEAQRILLSYVDDNGTENDGDLPDGDQPNTNDGNNSDTEEANGHQENSVGED